MKEINVVFDGILDDVDIITVPDAVEAEIDEIGQEFLDWLPTANESEYWMVLDGKKLIVAETEGFVKWLNNNHCEIEKAHVVERNTNYNPENKSVEF